MRWVRHSKIPTSTANDCGAVDQPDAADGTRTPCAACGSTAQQVRLLIEDSVSLHPDLRIAVREGDPGRVKPHLIVQTGEPLSHRLGRWVHRTRRIDRKNDQYEETIIDPVTGEEIHRDAAPLSEHQGHGDARRRPPRAPSTVDDVGSPRNTETPRAPVKFTVGTALAVPGPQVFPLGERLVVTVMNWTENDAASDRHRGLLLAVGCEACTSSSDAHLF